jgi:hypothetical protein
VAFTFDAHVYADWSTHLMAWTRTRLSCCTSKPLFLNQSDAGVREADWLATLLMNMPFSARTRRRVE